MLSNEGAHKRARNKIYDQNKQKKKLENDIEFLRLKLKQETTNVYKKK